MPGKYYPLLSALSDRIVDVSANRIENHCLALGLNVSLAGDPWKGKKRFVDQVLEASTPDAWLEAAKKILLSSEDYELEDIVKSIESPGFEHGEIKNIIFASIGKKPDIRLANALKNKIEIVKNKEDCLVFESRISEHHGLTLENLIDWWKSGGNTLSLFNRLRDSIPSNSPGEKLLFEVYYKQIHKELGEKIPALLPQVHLYYDPILVKQRQASGEPALTIQRIDFLMLLPRGIRIILEVDGMHHYSREKVASPLLYAKMVCEDRTLKLDGYEVYRFGGGEFINSSEATSMLLKFFRDLFKKHHLFV